MNTVQPIRDKGTVMDIADYLHDKNPRDYVMFMTGIYSGLRISDILTLRVRDVKNRDHISIREKKTGKERRFKINADLRRILRDYIDGKPDYEYLFKSPRGNKPITRQQAYNILSEAGEKFGVESVGTHTLRKTFGFHMYQGTKDAAMIMDILNHSSIQHTLRYIGINQDTKDKAFDRLSFRR